MNLLHQFEGRMNAWRVRPFFRYLVFSMVGVYVLDLLYPGFGLVGRMKLESITVFRGEVWRLLTFLFIPPGGGERASIIQTALILYFYYFLGNALESRWGPRRFLLFYQFGAIGAVAAGLLTGTGTNLYLNLSILFAFAIINPEYPLLLFFILPVKIKWLAALNGIYQLYQLINSGWPERAAILFSLINLLLFLGGDLLSHVRSGFTLWKRRRLFRKSIR